MLGTVPGIIGCMQATEVLKVLLLRTGRSESERLRLLSGKQVYYDGMTGITSNFSLHSPDPDCVLCGSSAKICTVEESRGNFT